MSDQTSSDGNTSGEEEDQGELRYCRAQGFFDKSFTIRVLIGIAFAIILFFFLHFKQTYIETLELGSGAKRFIVAQIDFAFPDEEATIILKQQAAHAIGPIYRIEEDQIAERTAEFQRYITQDETGSAAWAEVQEESQFEDVATALSLFSDRLYQSRFTDRRTVARLKTLPQDELPLPLSSFFPFYPIHGRTTAMLPSLYWSQFRPKVLSGVPEPVSTFLLSYFDKLTWKFDIDQGTEYTLRKLAQAQIPQKFTRVRAGERLIDQGEKVTARHITMLQSMKEKLSEERNLLNPQTFVGTLLMTLLLLSVSVVYLKENHSTTFSSNKRLSLLASILTLALVLAKLVELFLINTSSHLIDLVHFPLFVPFAAILLTSLMNVRIATFASIFLSIVFVMALAVESVPFLVVNTITAMVAILTSRQLRRRKEVFIVCAKAWLASLLVVLAFHLYENTTFSFSFVGDMTSSFLFMAITAVLVVGLLPILESVFRIMTDITLMEFLDPSNELLRRLSIEAPGTYQHSMVVGHLAESAASAIGANGLFCRVATQYHDIGKLSNPQYFTENQLGGIDMHQLLSPQESTQVIIAHVSDGVALARKVGLPEQFIDIIKEHHGTTLAYYFYHKQIELMGGDKSQVDEMEFRYSGPKPRTKESTIVMIADTLEAASRSLENFSEQAVVDLVDNLISQKSEDGQFDDSLLTFEELGIVKRVIIKTLLAASHPRIKYPPHHPGEEG